MARCPILSVSRDGVVVSVLPAELVLRNLSFYLLPTAYLINFNQLLLPSFPPSILLRELRTCAHPASTLPSSSTTSPGPLPLASIQSNRWSSFLPSRHPVTPTSPTAPRHFDSLSPRATVHHPQAGIGSGSGPAPSLNPLSPSSTQQQQNYYYSHYTNDGNGDRSGNGHGNSKASATTTATTSNAASNSNTTAYTATPATNPSASNNTDSSPVATAASSNSTSNTTTSSKPAEAGHRQQQMNHFNVPSNPSPSPSSLATPALAGHDSHSLPSITNLINHHQHDGASNNHNNHGYASSTYSASLGSHGITPAPSASPGTDPSRLQHQQQQAHPPPPQPNPVSSTASSTTTSTMQQQGQPQLHQLHQQHQQHQQSMHSLQPQQQQLQQPLQQQHHAGGGAQPASQPRVTKGKYSLADFDIQRTLGTGSFGRVHLVQSKHNQRFYAVKVLKKAQVVKMKQVEHTNDERRMLSDVKHPFLITLWGTFQDWKNLYMVMDFVEGGELFSLLRKSGRFPNPVAKFYAAEVTLALEYLHSKNIIYRDLKPENLLLDRHGHLKITDFGFAKRVPDKTWTLCGTPDYLAPEVVSNKGYNKSVDWWSLGILIYEMLCGYTPFWDGGSPMKIYENITKGVVKYPGYINPDAQNLLEHLITADLTKRLGNLYGGSQDVKSHPWFSEVTWDRLARKDIDAPYTPPVKAGMGDASQFDRYPEDPDKYGGSGGADEFGHLFTEF